MSNIIIKNYSEKSFVLRGTIDSNSISILGGKWNDRLKGGPGWIFPMIKKSQVENWIENNIENKPPVRPILKKDDLLNENNILNRLFSIEHKLDIILQQLSNNTNNSSNIEETTKMLSNIILEEQEKKEFCQNINEEPKLKRLLKDY